MNPIPVTHPEIEYGGRIDFTDHAAPRYSYSGCSVRARFEDTSIAAVLENEGTFNVFNIIVDSAVIQRLAPAKGPSTYTLASGLGDTVRTSEIYKLTESPYGKTTFRGFLADAGKTLVPLTDRHTRVIEFVGDSITCGSGIECGPGTGHINTNQNHYVSYAAITSRNFNARHTVAAKSGVGLFINYGGTPIRPLVQRVATTANAKNHGGVSFFELSQQGALGFGGDNHPNVAQHAINAEELTAFIATL